MEPGQAGSHHHRPGRTNYDGYRNGVLQYRESGNGDRTLCRLDEDLESSLVVDPLGRQYCMAHDSSGNRVAEISPLGNRTTFGYDSTGNMIWSVGSRGNVSGTDSAQLTTTFEYDFNGNRTAIHRPAVGAARTRPGPPTTRSAIA